MSKEWVRLRQGVCPSCGQLYWTENVNSHRYLVLGWQLKNYCEGCDVRLIEPLSWNEEASEKQIKLLKSLGYENVSSDYTKQTASDLISLKVGEP